jgi:hypothetical protein
VLEGNLDLLDTAGALLAALPQRALRLTPSLDGSGTLTLQVGTVGIERLDVFVDGRPRASADVSDGDAVLTVTGVPGAARVRVDGYSAGELVASRVEAV